MTDAAQNTEDVNNIRRAMKSAEGPNASTQPVYVLAQRQRTASDHPAVRGRRKDGIPEYQNVSRGDMMAHRVRHQMMGIIPNNTGGFGDVEKTGRVFVRNELMPLQKRPGSLTEVAKRDSVQESPTLGLE